MTLQDWQGPLRLHGASASSTEVSMDLKDEAKI